MLNVSRAPERFSYQRSELVLRNLLAKQKELGLTAFDLSIFFYLVLLSRRRVFLKVTIGELAEEINASPVKVSKSLKVLIALNLCKGIDYGRHKGFIVNPEIINNGDDKKKAFKFRLWKDN